MRIKKYLKDIDTIVGEYIGEDLYKKTGTYNLLKTYRNKIIELDDLFLIPKEVYDILEEYIKEFNDMILLVEDYPVSIEKHIKDHEFIEYKIKRLDNKILEVIEILDIV